ncbi:unnamed protein product [Caenorhabditis brenneri]
MSEPTSPYWLASASGLNAAENTGSNSSSLPPLPIHLSDYFTNPDYLKSKDQTETKDAQCPPEWQPPTNGASEAYLQPVTGRMPDVYGTDQHTAQQFSQRFNVDTTSYNHSKQFSDRQPDGQIQSKEWQIPTNEVPEAHLQPVTGRMSDVYGTDQYTAHQFSRNFNVDPTSNNHTNLTFDGHAADQFQSKKWQPPTSGVPEAYSQPVTEKMPDFYGTDQHTAYQFSQSFNVDTTSNNGSKQTFDGQAKDLYQSTDFRWQTPFTHVNYPQALPNFNTPGYSSFPPQSVVPTFSKTEISDDSRNQKKQD